MEGEQFRGVTDGADDAVDSFGMWNALWLEGA